MRKKIILSSIIFFALFSCEEKSCDIDYEINPETQDVYENFERVEKLSGTITDMELQSTWLNENRRVTIYQPPGYDSNNTYGVLLVTDDIGVHIPYYIEKLILEEEIEPIFIVGVYNRTEQPIDSIFGDYIYDFRNMEFMNDAFLRRMTNEEFKDRFNGQGSELKEITKYKDVRENPELLAIVSNRYERFCKFINTEVIPYVTKNYSITEDKDQWTCGGLSSGGAFIYSYSCNYPGIFGNAIVMSPGGPSGTYDFSKSTSNYFIAAGNEETYFYKESGRYLKQLDKLEIPYIHQTYNSGHKMNMWMTFYLECVKKIYCKK